MPALILVVLALFLFIVLAGLKRRPKNFPPGPVRLPFIGNVNKFGIDGYRTLVELSKTYGDIMGIAFGLNWVVVLNNPDDIREAFSKTEFTGRSGYNGLLDTQVEDGNYGVIFSYGKTWVEHRRFSLRTLRDLGFGKRSSENIIMEEVRELSSQMAHTAGQPFKTQLFFNPAIFNVIWSVVAGQRYAYDDPKLTELQNLLLQFFKTAQSPIRVMLQLFPAFAWLRTKFPFLVPVGDGDRFRNKVFEFFRTAIAEHKDTITEGQPRDFIDTYLEEVKKTQDPSSSFYPNPKDGDINFIVTLLDLFIAGSETTSTTLMWSFFLLAQFPESQEKVAKEIKSRVGSREVLLEDRPHLPYVEATILEIMRHSSLAPLTLHGTTEDLVFKGYNIPKDTIVFGNLYAVHHSTSIWGDPENFRPERFLSQDGKTVVRNKAWMPFGFGKRVCMGESLARDELFLFFTNLVKQFHISMPADEPKHSLIGVNHGVLVPEDHNIVVHVRK